MSLFIDKMHIARMFEGCGCNVKPCTHLLSSYCYGDSIVEFWGDGVRVRELNKLDDFDCKEDESSNVDLYEPSKLANLMSALYTLYLAAATAPTLKNDFQSLKEIGKKVVLSKITVSSHHLDVIENYLTRLHGEEE